MVCHLYTSLITRVVYLSFFMSSKVGNRSPSTESTCESVKLVSYCCDLEILYDTLILMWRLRISWNLFLELGHDTRLLQSIQRRRKKKLNQPSLHYKLILHFYTCNKDKCAHFGLRLCEEITAMFYYTMYARMHTHVYTYYLWKKIKGPS